MLIAISAMQSLFHGFEPENWGNTVQCGNLQNNAIFHINVE